MHLLIVHLQSGWIRPPPVSPLDLPPAQKSFPVAQICNFFLFLVIV